MLSQEHARTLDWCADQYHLSVFAGGAASSSRCACAALCDGRTGRCTVIQLAGGAHLNRSAVRISSSSAQQYAPLSPGRVERGPWRRASPGRTAPQSAQNEQHQASAAAGGSGSSGRIAAGQSSYVHAAAVGGRFLNLEVLGDS
jgi:hypothetical protein